MDNPDRLHRFLRRVDLSLDLLTEEKDKKTESNTKKPTSTFLSKEQLDEHFDKHYQGYLKGLEDAYGRLSKASLDDENLTRSILLDINYNYNGVVLHELYFGCLGAKPLSDDLEKTLNESFDSKNKMMSMLKAASMASRGWAFMGYDLRSKQMRISLIDSHDLNVPLWCPVLALDVQEHAYYIDFKSDKEKYVDGLLEDINWDAVGQNIAKIV